MLLRRPAQKVVRGMTENALKSKYNGGTCLIGYLIDTFINAIFLYDDEMVITFNYKEGTTTITFDDLKAALTNKKTDSDLDRSTAPRRSKRQIACSVLFYQPKRTRGAAPSVKRKWGV